VAFKPGRRSHFMLDNEGRVHGGVRVDVINYTDLATLHPYIVETFCRSWSGKTSLKSSMVSKRRLACQILI
jgi:hypothetical protein